MKTQFTEMDQAFLDFRRLEGWGKAIKKLFPESIPQEYTWDNIDEIVKVLNTISSGEAMAYSFLPGGGWQQFNNFKPSSEPGFIDLDRRSVYSFPAGQLIFHSILDDCQWYYFELVPNPDVKPIFDKEIPYYEALTVLDNKEYAPYMVWETEEPYRGYEPTENMSVKYRYYDGRIVLFSARSAYDKGIGIVPAQTILGSDGFRYFIRMCAKGAWRVSFEKEYYYKIKERYEDTLVK